MAGLADWLEDYRNWRGRQEWEQGKGWQDFYNGDPVAQERAEKMMGFGTGSHGLSNISGLAGIFAGPKAKSADLKMLKKAEEVLAAGATPEKTWFATGWGKAPWDQKMRFEIPDQASKFTKDFTQFTDAFPSYDALDFMRSGVKKGSLSDIFQHEKLYEAYPELASMEIRTIPKSIAGNTKAEYGMTPEGDYIGLRENLDPIEARRSLIHELQHVVQRNEGFSRGTSPEEIARLFPGVDSLAKYRLAGGEAEARNVALKRLDYSLPSQRRLLYPWESYQYDVPINKVYDIGK